MFPAFSPQQCPSPHESDLDSRAHCANRANGNAPVDSRVVRAHKLAQNVNTARAKNAPGHIACTGQVCRSTNGLQMATPIQLQTSLVPRAALRRKPLLASQAIRGLFLNPSKRIRERPLFAGWG